MCSLLLFCLYIYLFICVELLLVWHIYNALLWSMCFLFPLNFQWFYFCVSWAVYCLSIVYQLATFMLHGFGFRQFVIVCAVFGTRISCTGYLRDFQGQYYSPVVISYKSCAVSISLLFFSGDTTVIITYDCMYAIIFGTVTCRNLAQNLILFLYNHFYTCILHTTWQYSSRGLILWLAGIILVSRGSGVIEKWSNSSGTDAVTKAWFGA
jgi:hypothetical protein